MTKEPSSAASYYYATQILISVIKAGCGARQKHSSELGISLLCDAFDGRFHLSGAIFCLNIYLYIYN
ncbi:hypothetical protein [Vibrio jasicida]|uniref:hypothetical protein n=1 Tax=Vibrio jasicida TaxID=766224 RepID=UPI00126894E4|nr:hypothetical protein [Vibrio jasicida]